MAIIVIVVVGGSTTVMKTSGIAIGNHAKLGNANPPAQYIPRRASFFDGEGAGMDDANASVGFDVGAFF